MELLPLHLERVEVIGAAVLCVAAPWCETINHDKKKSTISFSHLLLESHSNVKCECV